MEITINLRLSADASLTALLERLNGNGIPLKQEKQIAKASEPEVVATTKGTKKVSVEELREAASSLMVKNKAALKEILAKYSAKTVAAIDESDYASALADIKKAGK